MLVKPHLLLSFFCDGKFGVICGLAQCKHCIKKYFKAFYCCSAAFDVVYRHRLLMSPCDSSVSASRFCRFFLLPPHFFPFKNKGFERSRQIPPLRPRVTSVPFPRGGSLLAVRDCPLP